MMLSVFTYTFASHSIIASNFCIIGSISFSVAKIEKDHEDRYRKLLANIKDGVVFSKDSAITWECGNCGFAYTGKDAVEVCPVCAHPRSYFFEKPKNY